MPKNLYQWLCAAAVLLVASAGWAQLASDISNEVIGGVPVVGVDVGAAIPISGFQKTADPGGSVAPWFGWQIGNKSYGSWDSESVRGGTPAVDQAILGRSDLTYCYFCNNRNWISSIACKSL